MDDIGKSPDHDRPVEIEAGPDLLGLREAAEHIAAALDLVGSTEIPDIHTNVIPSLAQIEKTLRRHIQNLTVLDSLIFDVDNLLLDY